MWIWLALLSGSGAAILAIIVKMHLKHINPLLTFLIFSLFTIAILLIFDLLTNKVDCKTITSLPIKDWLILFIASALNTFAFICYLSALKYGPTGGVVALDRMGIIFALILAVFFLQEKLTILSLLGGALMVIGAFLISV